MLKKMFKPKSLRQAYMLYLIGPVLLLLIGMGATGFMLGSNYLIRQWQQTTLLQLQKNARMVDARLNKVIQWIRLFQEAADEPHAEEIQDWIIREAEAEEGIVRVEIEGHNALASSDTASNGGRASQPAARSAAQAFAPPAANRSFPQTMRFRYDDLVKGKTISIVSDLRDRSGMTIGALEMVVDFSYLLQALDPVPWRQDGNTALVDTTGTFLTDSFGPDRKRLGDNGDEVERMTLKALRGKPCGTIRGDDYPSQQVISYCRLEAAPWSLVIMSPTQEILAPVIHFRFLYGLSIIAFILIIFLLIRYVSKGVLTTVTNVSDAARTLSEGRFDINVPVKRDDEVGDLARAFNAMAGQLEERISLRQALDLAMEVQRSFLPRGTPHVAGLDIAGQSIYCDQTGGDYYDYLRLAEDDRGPFIAVVGDGVGHGISAALLMTTVRGLLRGRLVSDGELSSVVTDINQLLCRDTSDSASFMTLFLMTVDPDAMALRWVRAGHDPAIVYDPRADTVIQLKGAGVALGFDESVVYAENCYSNLKEGQIIVIGTDGLWETENQAGERFGKERIYAILRQNAHRDSNAILQTMTAEMTDFRGSTPQSDDVTVVVVKIAEKS